jgi:serine/threonine protein kinase
VIGRYREPVEGTPFGRYQLIELLGRGGMGEVWRAHDTTIDRVVALKMLLSHYAQDEDFDKRFRREARTAARLDDPHVVPIYDVGEIDGRLYVTMRLINGVDLDTLLKTGPLKTERAVHIIEQIAGALHSAHQAGLVHRDVKPSNILLADNDFAYLIDFGIARAADDTKLTSEGSTIGTWAYMAPERFNTPGDIEPSSDIYALPRQYPRAGRGGPHGRSAPQSLRDERHRSAGIGPGDRNGSGQTNRRAIPHRRRNGRRRATRHHRTDQPTRRRSNTTEPGEPQQSELACPATPDAVASGPLPLRRVSVSVHARAVQRTQSAGANGTAHPEAQGATPRRPDWRLGVHRHSDRVGRHDRNR